MTMSTIGRGPASARGRLLGWSVLTIVCCCCRGVGAQTPSGSIEPPEPNASLIVPVPVDAVQIAPEILPILGEPQDADVEYSVSLRDAELQVLNRHPRVQQALAAEQAERGRWLQVGLKPNPTIGYVANEVGNEGRAGQQGAYLSQTIVRGGKLGVNRVVASHLIVMRQQDVVAAQQKVLTDVRLAFFELLVLQQRHDILQRLLELTHQAESTARQLFEARESPKTDYLQARIELNRLQVDVQNTEVALRRAQSVLAARMMIQPDRHLHAEGELDERLGEVSWSDVRDQVLATHPAIVRALADVRRARSQVRREQVQIVPDLMTQTSVQYDNATLDTVASVQAGIRLPIWDRNQGAISAAWSEVRVAEQRVEQIRLDLDAELADYLNELTAAQQRAVQYDQEILPQAGETQRLIAEAYRQGEVGFLNYLTAQRTFFQATLTYLDTLLDYWSGHAKMQGMLPPTVSFQPPP